MSLKLTQTEQEMLTGKQGFAPRKSMEILTALAKIYGAKRMIPVSSVQVAGVSYDNLGDAGLEYLETLATSGGTTRVLTTLNPAGMDIENWQKLGIDAEFAEKQMQVIRAFTSMQIITTCTCTPYLAGNLPHFGEHIAWAESSAVCFANSVIGARTNREGGPSALASALTGVTPEYGLHLTDQRKPDICFTVSESVPQSKNGLATFWFGALGKVIGQEMEKRGTYRIPLVRGITGASLEELKSFSASLATYGGVALFHMEGITPEASLYKAPAKSIRLVPEDFDSALQSLQEANPEEVDFISLGCPHLSIKEIAYIAGRLDGKKVHREFWLTTARPTKQIADLMGYTRIIESSGVKFATDTCCVVAPIKAKFHTLATDSAKTVYYGYAKNAMQIYYRSIDEILDLATQLPHRTSSS
jgi:predicted aconitase